MRYQPLAQQNIQPVTYALDRALGFRASRETRAMLHEMAQRIFTPESSTEATKVEFTGKIEGPTPQVKLITQGLASLVWEANKHPEKLSFEPQISLVSPSSSGGKFWKATATAKALHLNWGKTGTAGSQKSLPFDQCQQNNPVLELKNRCLGKLAKGYDIVPTETQLP